MGKNYFNETKANGAVNLWKRKKLLWRYLQDNEMR